MNDAEKWQHWCALTCMGGSEKKGCPCEHPDDCLMRFDPDFEEQKRAAVKRLWRCAFNETQDPTPSQEKLKEILVGRDD